MYKQAFVSAELSVDECQGCWKGLLQGMPVVLVGFDWKVQIVRSSFHCSVDRHVLSIRTKFTLASDTSLLTLKVCPAACLEDISCRTSHTSGARADIQGQLWHFLIRDCILCNLTILGDHLDTMADSRMQTCVMYRSKSAMLSTGAQKQSGLLRGLAKANIEDSINLQPKGRLRCTNRAA